jgi:hypothetical protein
MPSLRVTAVLATAALFAIALSWSLIAGVFWRRRLIRLLKTSYPGIWAPAMASPDVSDPLGRPMPSSSLLMKAVADAQLNANSDPGLVGVVLWLKRSNTTLITCIVLLIALVVAAKLFPR